MKFKIQLVFVLMALAAVTGTKADAQTVTTNFYSQTVNAAIPTENPNGYNTAIDVSGIIGTITELTVFLNVTNGYNGDLYAYLDDPAGTQAILLNRVGVGSSNPFGYGDSGFDMAFDALATNNIHYYQTLTYNLNSAGQLTGTWAADGRSIDPESAPGTFSTAPITATLSLDLGSNPNGEWTLFIADVNSGYPSSLVDWGLEVQTIPEPAAISLSIASITWGFLFLQGRFRSKAGKIRRS